MRLSSLIIPALAVAGITSALFLSSSVDISDSDFLTPMSDIVYSVRNDVTPLVVDQPSSFAWRVVNGSLQRQNGFGQWETANNLGMSQFFNDYNIATLADVQAAVPTLPDLVSSYNQYFGNFPTVFSYRKLGQASNQTSTQFNSYLDLFSTFLQEWSLHYVTSARREYLGPDGSVLTVSNTSSQPSLMLYGMLGLSRNMIGPNGSMLFDRYGSPNDFTVSSILGGLNAINYNLLSMYDTDLLTSILQADGTVSDDFNGMHYLHALVVGDKGLAAVMRGQSGNSPNMSFLDYSDLSSTNVSANNILDMLALGFEANQNLLATYLYSHGTDLDIDIRHNMQQQANTFVEQFTSSSGQGTPSDSDISNTAGISGGFSDTFASSATSADAFNQLNNSGNWSYFSQDTANELEPNNQIATFNNDGYFDYFSQYLEDVRLGVGSTW